MEDGRRRETGMEADQQMRPPLHTAVLLGIVEDVRKLLVKDADVEEVDFAGCTATQLAAASGFLDIAKLLLASGAKPEIKDSSHGNTSLHEASWRGYSGLVKLLSRPATIDVQNNGGFSPLHLACQAGHNQTTRELLLAGSNPNLVNTYGDTPLHTAVRYGHAGVTRILLSARTLPDIQNKNGDTAMHIASAMGRKKLTKILLSAACNPNLRNHQRETPLDISLRKEFTEVTQVIQNPPKVLTPIQRDEMRASKYKGVPGTSKDKVPQTAGPSANTNVAGGRASQRISKNVAVTQVQVHKEDPGGTSKSKSSKSKSREKLAHFFQKSDSKPTSSSLSLQEKVPAQLSSPSSRGGGQGQGSAVGRETTDGASRDKVKAAEQVEVEEVPKWSPYGCHYHPNPGAFPAPNIDSLPSEPLTTGELYYLDLAGNIHKGPMGVSEGCYCGTLLSQNQNSQSMMALNKPPPQQQPPAPPPKKMRGEPKKAQISPGGQGHGERKYEDQLRSLTNQLSKIHMDTQAQLSSLHSILNERLKDPVEESEGYNEGQLKDWVKQYRRFRKELTKNPKTLNQANDLLASASALLSTRLASPAPPDSDTDSGI